jgi:glycosyltransferase involved in cell wall biosynthesis
MGNRLAERTSSRARIAIDRAEQILPHVRIALILPGLGRVQRGAETAFLEVARALEKYPDVSVELFGSGADAPAGVPMHRVGCVGRETFEDWPRLPALRSECHYEELTWVLNLAWKGVYRPRDFDVTVTCAYPFVNWFLQRAGGRHRPAQVFVTQNGDWMCQARNREYRYFHCDGLVCINPTFYERNRDRYRSVLIPNGVDPTVFTPDLPAGLTDPDLGLEIAPGHRVVVMASALAPSKGVADGVRAVARVPDAHLVVAGDGPERAAVANLARELLPGRCTLLGSIPRQRMAALFRRGDAFLHMSRDEPFGIVYLEAASTGLPCVVHRGEVPRWILDDAALYADTANPEEVGAALRQALTAETGVPLGRAARARVLAGWTWHAQAKRYRDFLRCVAADHMLQRRSRGSAGA